VLGGERMNVVFQMRSVKQKVFAYITHNQHLLVFNHPFAPEAGIQVPAGTIEEGEHPEAAVLREAFEETGLIDLTLDCFLGEQKRDMSDLGRDEIHYRRFYHLRCHKTPLLHGDMKNSIIHRVQRKCRSSSSSSGYRCRMEFLI
jgi:8-oxo-dGTP pyrophosphatase MutT (NUDIX family)